MEERVEQIELLVEVVRYYSHTSVYSICTCGIRLMTDVPFEGHHHEHLCPNCNSTIVTRVNGDSYSMYVMKDIPPAPVVTSSRWEDLLEE